MKKNKICILFIAVICFLPQFVNAAGAEEIFIYEGISYEISSTVSKSVTLIAPTNGEPYSGYSYSIPDKVSYGDEDYTVTAIGKKAFYDCENLIMIELPQTMDRIEESAFWYCKKLKKIKLPDSVTEIGANAFSLCSNLTEVFISPSSSLKTIGRSAFSSSGLQKIYVPQSVTIIGDNAFADCEGLDSIKVDANDVYESPNECQAIIRKQDHTLLYGCHNTKIPYGTVTIGKKAFSSCSRLYNIVLPNTVKSISESAFWYCDNLETIELSSSLESIDDNAFWFCKKLRDIQFPATLLNIGRGAFQNTGLSSVYIPKSVLSIGQKAFGNCNSLIVMEVENGNVFYTSVNNAIVEGNTLLIGCKSTIVPSTVNEIGDYAFHGCSFSNITIPSNVKTIKRSAFNDCDKLSSVTIENGLKTIGESAFSFCSNLTSITLPQSVEIVNDNAFSYCRKLQVIESLNETPKDISGKAFEEDVYSNATLIVPLESIDIYRQKNGWNKFVNIQEKDFTRISNPIVNGLRMYSTNGILYIESATSCIYSIYAVSGQLMRMVALKQGVNTVEGLSKGIYIVNGQKIMVR